MTEHPASTRRPWLAAALAAALAATVAAALPPQAAAQAFPSKTLSFVIPFAAGSATDQLGRALGRSVSEQTGQPVVVENKGGASGQIAAQLVANAAPDGYTVLITTTSVVVNPALYAKTGYELDKLVPVTEIASSANAIAAYPGYGVKTLPEAITKARGAKASFGSPGNGSTSHLTGEYLFNSVSQADVQHVPYRGGALAVADTLGGQTPFVVVPIPVIAQHVKSGKLVALAVTSEQRYPEWPDVATVSEAGFPGYLDATWVGAFVPAGTPAEIVATLNAKLVEALGLPEVRNRLAAAGLAPRGTSSAQFAKYVQDEAARWKSVIEKTGVKAE